MGQLLVKARCIIDGTGASPLQNGAVLIDGNRIAAVGAAQDLAAAEATVLDLEDSTLLPGLVEAHAHVLFTGELRPMHQQVNASDHELLFRGVHNAALALRAGITTVRDCGDVRFISLAVRDAIQRGQVPGPHFLCSGPVITPTGGHGWYYGIEADSVTEIRKAVRTVVKQGADYVKIMGTGGFGTVGVDVAGSQYSLEEYRVALGESHRLGKRLAVHVHGAEGVKLAVQAGIDSLEHVSFATRDNLAYDEKVVEDIVHKGLYVSLAMPATWYRVSPEIQANPALGALREARYEVIRRLYAAGVHMVISTDSGSPGTRIDQLALLAEFIATHLQIPAMEVIRSCTARAAACVGLGDEVGTIKAGKRADLLAVRGDPLSDMQALRQVHTVIQGGEVVF